MHGSYIESYYSQTLPHEYQRPHLQRTLRTETCIIGDGLARHSTSLTLVVKGKDLVTVETNEVGRGTSGRNRRFVTRRVSLSR